MSAVSTVIPLAHPCHRAHGAVRRRAMERRPHALDKSLHSLDFRHARGGSLQGCAKGLDSDWRDRHIERRQHGPSGPVRRGCDGSEPEVAAVQYARHLAGHPPKRGPGRQGRSRQRLLSQARQGTRWQDEKRWVVFAGDPDPTCVPPGWYGWLHRRIEKAPSEQALKTHQRWEKERLPNLTGTAAAYLPPGDVRRGGQRLRAPGDYEAWRPE